MKKVNEVEFPERQLGPNQPVGIEFPRSRFLGDNYDGCFCSSFYSKFKWIDYNLEEDAVYCFPCKVFHMHKGGTFVNKGYSNWKKAPERLLKHHISKNHKICMTLWINKKVMDARKTSVAQEILSHHKETVLHNRLYMKIIETVHFCAVQNLAYRAHVEDRGDLENVSDINRGNFLEILSQRCRDDSWFSDQVQKRNLSTTNRITGEQL